MKIRILDWYTLYVSEDAVRIPDIIEVTDLNEDTINIAAEEAAEVDINNFGDEIGLVVTEWEEI